LNKGDKPLARHLRYHEEIQSLMKGKVGHMEKLK